MVTHEEEHWVTSPDVGESATHTRKRMAPCWNSVSARHRWHHHQRTVLWMPELGSHPSQLSKWARSQWTHPDAVRNVLNATT